MQLTEAEFEELVIQKIMDSEEVQWNWTLISQCIILADDSTELLREIVTLWVTIRGFSIVAVTIHGFSIVASWVESYKVECQKNPKKQPGFRKGLQRSQ